MGLAISKSSNRADRGFTLIEILVALTIVSIALMASLRAVGSLTVSAAELRNRTLAQWSAENQLALIRVQQDTLPPVGRQSFACDQGDLRLRCDQIVQTTANPNFRRVDVQVYDTSRGDGAMLARLIGFATTVR